MGRKSWWNNLNIPGLLLTIPQKAEEMSMQLKIKELEREQHRFSKAKRGNRAFSTKYT